MGRRPRGRRDGPYAVGADELDVARPQGPDGKLLARLEADVRVRNAALIAHTFPGLDPAAILDERDPLKRLLRLAAHNVVQDEAERARRRQKT